MTGKDIARMVSLADEKYIDEMFVTKLYDRKNISWLKTLSAAAAMAALVIGIGAASVFLGNENDRPDLQTIVSETGTDLTDYSGNAALSPVQPVSDPADGTKRTLPIDYDKDFDYGIYFQTDRFDGIIDYTLEAGGQNYYFKSDHIYEVMPFDTSVYDEPKTATVYCDESGKPVNAEIYCIDFKRGLHQVSVRIAINDDGALFPDYLYDTENIFDGAPERFGVKIRGYTITDWLNYKDVCAVFRVNGIGYTVKIYGMTYAEAVGIIDSLIESNPKAADFDLSRGVKQKLTLEEANEAEPYAGCVVTSDRIGEMSLRSCERKRDIDGENLFIYYEKPASQEGDTYKSIVLTYYTNSVLFESYTRQKGRADDLYADVKEYELVDSLESYNYEFNFVLSGAYLNGRATCTEEELTEYLEQLRYQAYTAAQARSGEGAEIYNDEGVPRICADYLYDYWSYAFKINYSEFTSSGFDPEKYFTDHDMLRYAGAKLIELAHTENNGIINFKIISHGASGGTTKDGKDWVKIDYDVDAGLSDKYTGDDYYNTKAAYMGHTAYFELDGGKIYRAFDLNDLRILGIYKNNAKYPLDIDMDTLLEEVGGSFSEGSYSAPLGHKDVGGVSFTSDVKDMTADVTFSYPSEWQVNNGTVEINGKKVFVIAPAWFASEGFVPDEYKIDMAMGREVTVIEEKYGSGNDGYEYMIHRSVPDHYSDTGVYEQYLYVIKSGDFYITVSFVVNEYLPDAECRERIIESVRISSPEYEEFQAQLSSAYGSLMQPVTGKVTAGYSVKTEDYHKGVDFDVPAGTNVCAADDGTVVTYEDTDKGYGTCVFIDHGKGLVTLYAHLSEAKVKEGDKVKKGDVIGLSGKTGDTVRDNLHFEVRLNGRNADPELFFGPDVPTSAETVSYHGREFARSELSEETLEWLDWYNSLTPEEQLAISYQPAELR